jgi:hypothetical protein
MPMLHASKTPRNRSIMPSVSYEPIRIANSGHSTAFLNTTTAPAGTLLKPAQ